MPTPKKKKKHLTNVQLVKEIMEFSDYGPMAQMFVMDALDKWSNRIIASKKEDFGDNPFVSYEAWVGVAKEIQAKLNDR